MTAALVLVVLLGGLGVFQAALAAGAPLGHFAWGGQQRVLSAGFRVGSLIAIGIYTVIALIGLDRAGAIDVLPDGLSRILMWAVFGYFCLGILLNVASRSKPERYTMTPLTVVLAALAFVVASG